MKTSNLSAASVNAFAQKTINYPNVSNNRFVKQVYLFSRNPVFLAGSTASLLYFVSIYIVSTDFEFCHVTTTAGWYVPISRYLYRIFTRCDWVEYWLFRQPRRKTAHVVLLD